MHPAPSTDVRYRMHAAHTHARTVLGLDAATDPHTDNPTECRTDGRIQAEAWGWCGRSLGMRVTPRQMPDQPLWLRLAAARADHTADVFWCGADDARRCLPRSIPRPTLLDLLDWCTDGWAYRAELYEHATTAPLSASPVLTSDIELPDSWWQDLHAALGTLASVPTHRHTTTADSITSSVERFAGPTPDLDDGDWRTAHGDLHWANLCGPPLMMLDWEGWGLAPAGYDLAVLHVHTLLVPRTAETIRAQLHHWYGHATARHAEIIAHAELLDGYANTRHLNDAARQHRELVATRLADL